MNFFMVLVYGLKQFYKTNELLLKIFIKQKLDKIKIFSFYLHGNSRNFLLKFSEFNSHPYRIIVKCVR